MSLQYKIMELSLDEKQLFMNMLDSCFKLRSLWIKSLLNNKYTDKQCEYASNEYMNKEVEFRACFSYLKMDSFTLSDIKLCT